jgi:hypothetical protein
MPLKLARPDSLACFIPGQNPDRQGTIKRLENQERLSMKLNVLSVLLLAAALLFPACIPSSPVQEPPPENTGTGPEAGEDAPPETDTGNGEPEDDNAAPDTGKVLSQLKLDMSNADKVYNAAQTRPLQDGSGYEITGKFGLTGTIRKKKDKPGTWVLAGSFTFPTAGYAVGDISVMPFQNLEIGGGQARLTDSNGIMILSIPVKKPAPGAVVAQAIEKVELHKEFRADPQSAFIIYLN